MKLKFFKVTNEKLIQLHAQEDELNSAMTTINKEIAELEKKKKKIAKQVSHNMRLRNKIINELSSFAP